MKIQEIEEDNSTIATIFFLPKKREQMMVGKYWHCGIIYKDKVYQILSGTSPFSPLHFAQLLTIKFTEPFFLLPSIENLKTYLPKLKKEKEVFLSTKIYPEKLDQEINSGTSGEQFVLRVMGMSNLKGDDKGNLQPTDVYKMIERKKYDRK